MHALASLVAWLVVAAPFAAGQTCNVNKCYQSVYNGPANQNAVDCESYMATMAIPCPVTSTHRSTATQYVSPHTVTATVTSTSIYRSQATAVATLTETEVDAQTTIATAAATQTAYSIQTMTITTFSTVLAPSTATVTVTSTSTSIVNAPLRARAPSSCTPHLVAGTALPAYAANCGKAAYASACSCLGARPTTISLSPITVSHATTTIRTVTPTFTVTSTVVVSNARIRTVFKTATAVVTGITTSTATTTITTTVTETLTNDVVAAATTTVLTAPTPTIAATTTATAVVPATVTACPIQQVQGLYVGQWLGTESNGVNLQYVTDESDALEFWIDDAGRLRTLDGQFAASLPADLGYAVLEPTDDKPNWDGSYALLCTENVDSTLSCVTSGPGPTNAFIDDCCGDVTCFVGTDAAAQEYSLTPAVLAMVCPSSV